MVTFLQQQLCLLFERNDTLKYHCTPWCLKASRILQLKSDQRFQRIIVKYMIFCDLNSASSVTVVLRLVFNVYASSFHLNSVVYLMTLPQKIVENHV